MPLLVLHYFPLQCLTFRVSVHIEVEHCVKLEDFGIYLYDLFRFIILFTTRSTTTECTGGYAMGHVESGRHFLAT